MGVWSPRRRSALCATVAARVMRVTRGLLRARLADHLLQRDDTLQDLHPAVHAEREHAIRHGRAQSITTEFAVRETSGDPVVEVRVRDNGRGIAHPPSYGYGLSSMRERVHELKGTLKIMPADRGTVLTVTIPLSANDAAQESAQSA